MVSWLCFLLVFIWHWYFYNTIYMIFTALKIGNDNDYNHVLLTYDDDDYQLY